MRLSVEKLNSENTILVRRNMLIEVTFMCLALDKEHLVAGFINRTKDQERFRLEDVMGFINVLWNIGCGPVSPNFTQQELQDFLTTKCEFVITEDSDGSFYIDRSSLYPREKALQCFDNMEQAKRVELLLRLNARINIPHQLLSAIGYGFMC